LLKFGLRIKISNVSIEQIEEAIEQLPAAERDALESRLLARRCGLDALNETERAELIASLDEAEREVDEGRTCNGDQLRQAVRSWSGK
jgi:hypothetical protein